MLRVVGEILIHSYMFVYKQRFDHVLICGSYHGLLK